MVNGRPTSFFQAHRGLRQGCPLSPFLYILMADSLSRKLTAEMNTDPSHQINETFIAKYAQGISLRHLSSDNTIADTCTWNLCRKSISNFSKHLYRIPSNGEKTLLWKYRIMNSPPLSSHAEIWDIRKWLYDVGIRKLNDISEWDSRGNWVDWAFPPVPAQLQYQTDILKSLLLNAALIHRSIADRWGWGDTGFYTPSLGYSALQTKKDSMRTPSFWKQVWHVKGLPKVNFFFWILMQNK
eukprot:PITA_19194